MVRKNLESFTDKAPSMCNGMQFLFYIRAVAPQAYSTQFSLHKPLIKEKRCPLVALKKWVVAVRL